MVPIHAEKTTERSLHDIGVPSVLPVRSSALERSPVAACGPRQHPWKITHALVFARALRAGTARGPNLIGSWSQCMRKNEWGLPMNRPTPDPSQEGSERSSAPVPLLGGVRGGFERRSAGVTL